MKLRSFHRNKKLNKRKILIALTTIFILTSGIVNYFDNNLIDSEQNEHSNSYNKKLRTAKISAPIHINNNWSEAKIAGICTGSGTWIAPYVIEDLIINGQNSSSCILIENTNEFFRIENCSVFNSSSVFTYGGGIKLNNVMNGTILNNNCSNNNGNGIYLTVSDNNTLSGNTINENYGGILLGGSTNNTILNNSAFNNDQRGIYLTSLSNNNTILNNNFTYNNQDGIFISMSHNNTIRGNIADHNYNGIWVFGSNDSIIMGNSLSYNDFIGLWLYRSNNSDVIGNRLVGNLNINIYESDSENNIFKWNVETGLIDPIIIDDDGGGDFTWDQCINSLAWIYGSGSYSDPYIIQNLIIDGQNSSSCIEIRDSNAYFRINNCTFYNSSSVLDNAGIKLSNVINGQLIDNDCSNNNGNGIYLTGSDNNTLSGNTINENYGGILLGGSTNNTILNNSAFNNDQRGIYLTSLSNNNTILNNNFTYNNQDGIFISMSHNNTIRGNIADHNYNGIWVFGSNDSIIMGNSLSYNDFIGLWLHRSNNTDVIGNMLIGNLGMGIYESESENNFFMWNYLDGIFSPFVIDNNGGGDFTWTEARNLFFWCTGSGSYSDPYIMNNLIIDGQNSSSCIEIRDSTVFFKIEGGTLSNSSSGLYNAGIKLSNVINGQLIDNDCSNNNGVGIGLYQSQNITIDGNIANNNVEFGIILEGSHNNNLSGNTLNENSNGVYLGGSTNNTISENSAFNNDLRGIYLSSLSNNNTIMNNNVTYNSDNGIDIYDSHDIKVIGNIADNNGWNGIFVWKCNNAIVARNIANYNTFAGLYLWSSNNTDVIGNLFIGNLHGIYEIDGENNVFNWNVDNGFTTSIIIDDSGTGDFTWVESVNQLAWIYGSGTLIDPYIIELITIDGLNLTSCLTIRNSNVYFKIRNCTFYNSGYNLNDGGIKLISTLNGELIYNNCSFNKANGIILDSCQSIIITENSINNNELSGIVLIDSNNIDIINNKETISFNDLYGIHLSNSHNNGITNNTITNNHIGIFLEQSNYNYIDWNNLLDNDQAIVDNGIGNVLGSNNVLPGGPIEFPFDILIIVLIIGLAVVGVTGAAIIIKKKRSYSGIKEKEISENKKEKVRIKLEAKLDLVDTLIRENNFKLAYKNLGKVKDTAELYEFFDIFNKANKKVEICKEKEEGISRRAIEEGVAPSVKEREAKVIVPVIKKEEDLRYNLFISYSTSDRDYFQIKRIVKELKKYPKINQVSYWEKDSKANIVEFMDKTLEVSNTFILFCSENSLKSNAVKDEWQAAFQMRKQGLIKLIPVYEEQEHIPKLLWHLLNVKYNQDDFKGFIENLYEEIIRG